MFVPAPASSKRAETPAEMRSSSCRSLYASNHSPQSTMCAVLEALSILGRETARIVLHGSCVVCERELPWTGRKASCCGSCWAALPRITGAKCDSCALVIPSEAREPLRDGDSSPSEPALSERQGRESNGRLGMTRRCIACLDDPLP